MTNMYLESPWIQLGKRVYEFPDPEYLGLVLNIDLEIFISEPRDLDKSDLVLETRTISSAGTSTTETVPIAEPKTVAWSTRFPLRCP